MKKFIELCKKPFLIATAILFLAFTVLLVVAYTTPFGNTYASVSTMEYDGVSINLESKIIFNSANELETSVKVKDSASEIKAKAEEVLGEEISEDDIVDLIKNIEENSTAKYTYTKENGKIFIEFDADIPGMESNNKIEVGEIRGYKIFGKSMENANEKIEYVCTANNAPQIASIVLMAISGVMLIGCIVVLVLDKVGVIAKNDVSKDTYSSTDAD